MGKRTRHDGDCTIYASLINGNPTDGICVCGYGWQCVYRDGDWSNMFSKERLEEIKKNRPKMTKEVLDSLPQWMQDILEEDDIKDLE